MQTFPGLDSIRAIAAVSVLATHTAFWSGDYSDGLSGAALARLDIGVAIFFVLSGFLISSPFLASVERKKPLPSVGRYFWKRILRIVPLYWLVVAIALLTLDDNAGSDLWVWISNLTFTQIYAFDQLPFGLTQMWSLSTEIAFYLLLPLFAWLIARSASRRGWSPKYVFTAVAILLVINIAWLLVMPTYLTRTSTWLPAFFSWFATGVVLAVLRIELNRGIVRLPFVHALANQPGTSWLIALSLFAIVSTNIAGPVLLLQPTGAEAVAKNLIYATISLLIIAPSVLKTAPSGRYERILHHRVFRHIGLISYGIFCIHLLVLHAVSDIWDLAVFDGHGALRFSLTLVFSLILAEIAYRVIELPAMRFKDWSPFRAAPITKPTQSELVQ